mgnify:CR=1 FL=1
MHREYHRWHSPSLGRDMDLVWYGHYGRPVLAFPTSLGRCTQNEDMGLIRSLTDKIEAALRQSLRIAQASNGWHGDAQADAAVLIAYVLGRWQLFAKSGFKRLPQDGWPLQRKFLFG